LKNWSTRDRFENKPPPVTDKLSYSRASSNKKYADYYYSTKYYSRQATSPIGKSYNTYYIRPSKQYGNSKYAHKFGIDQYADKVKKYKDATVRQISYYSFLCSNFDTSCTECTLIDEKKAKCPKNAFCFMKDEKAQCGSCLKFGKRCTGCNLTNGCTECIPGYW
jgi:hypothetical protein